MDFAARLASLNHSANAAARRRGRSPSGGDYERRQRPRQNSRPPQDVFANLRRIGYCIDPPRAETPKEEGEDAAAATNEKPHICLLAITIDELAYEDLWKEWISSADAHVSLVCHAKFPDRVKSPWLRQRLLLEPPRIGRGNQLADPVPRTHRPEWGSVEILRAMLDIVHDGLLIGTESPKEDKKGDDDEAKTEPTDPRFDPNRYYVPATVDDDDETSPERPPPADKLIFISETCIPIRPLKECCDELFAHPDQSWMNARNSETPGTPRNKYEGDQFSDIRVVPPCFRWKADQWMVLSRLHAIAIRRLDNHLPEHVRLWKKGFSPINASDEMYFPTVMAILQILKQPEKTKAEIEKESQLAEKNATKEEQAAKETTEKEGSTEKEPQPDEEKEPEAEKDDAEKTNAPTSLVALRPVTFTDWSEGMKNPKSHTSKNLPNVAKLTKEQGCLFARKFAGPISVEEWKQAIQSEES